MKVYSTSRDCEVWRHTELHDAVCELVDDLDGELSSGDVVDIYEGDVVKPKASAFLPRISELMAEIAYNDIGDTAENWPGAESADSLQCAVSEFVDRWFDERKMHPEFGAVNNIRLVSIEILSLRDTVPEWRRVEP